MTTTRAEPAQLNPTAAILIILLIACLLRLLWLGGPSLWLDEFHTLRMAREMRLLTEGIPGDQHPPLYYLFMTLWISISDSELWLRLPSALSGILSVVIIWRIGVVLERPRLGLFAAFLLAVLPLHIWYSREARMYGVVSLFWLSSLYFYWGSLRRDKWSDSLGLATSNAVAFLLAYPSLALWVLQMSFFLLGWSLSSGGIARAWADHKMRIWRFALAQLPIIGASLLWWPYMQIQFGRGGAFRWVLPGLDLTASLAQALTVAGLLGFICLVLVSLASLLLVQRPGLLAWLTKLATLGAWLSLALFLPILILGIIPRGLSIRRQLLVFLPIVVLLTAWALTQLNRPALTAGVGLLALGLGSAVLPTLPYEDWRSAVDFVAEHEAAGDELFLLRGYYEPLALAYYYDGMLSGERLISGDKDISTRVAAYSAGTTVWVLANASPAEADRSAELWSAFESRGSQVAEATFRRFLIVRAFKIE